MNDKVFFSTELVEASLRNETWRELVAPLFSTRLADPDHTLTYDGFIDCRMLDTVLLLTSSLNAQHLSRDHRLILDSELDCYLVILLLSGSCSYRKDGSEVQCGRGDILIIDLMQPLEIDTSAATISGILFPRNRLEPFVRGRNIHGSVFNSRPALNAIFADTVLSIFANLGELSQGETISLEEVLVNMIGAFTAREIQTPFQSEYDPLRLLRQRILEYIDENAFNPDLTPKLILERFNISRAHLYRVFAMDGGVTKIIREKRLDFAYRTLAQGPERRTIKGLAHNLGFKSTNQFQRAFMDRFNITPRDASQSALVDIYDFLPTRRLFAYLTRFATQ